MQSPSRYKSHSAPNYVARCETSKPRIARVGKINFNVFPVFWPNLGPLDSGRGDVEFAGILGSEASLADSFVTESIFWNLADEKIEKRLQTRQGKNEHQLQNQSFFRGLWLSEPGTGRYGFVSKCRAAL